MGDVEYDTIEELWKFIKHGDEDHQQWLREALYAFFRGEERPEPR